MILVLKIYLCPPSPSLNPLYKQKQTSTLKPYYLIKDKDNTLMMPIFLLNELLRRVGISLVNNYQNIKKVISVYIPQEGEVFI